MRNEVLRSHMKKVPFMLHSTAMDSLLEMANSETPRAESITPIVANESVTYEKRGHIAIISVDGGMYKKGMSGMCSSIASYQQMVMMSDKAENDDEVEIVIRRVDTPGGAVAGADEVEDRIYKSKKRTITFYENMGASAGIYIFSASDELYASESTMLGSIGVVVSYMEQEEDSKNKRVEIVSKNAPNKRCSLNGTCKEEIQTMIDTYEEMFYARVMKNTGFTEERIKQVFNNGGMIFAKEAQREGFIKEVTTFDALLKSLQKNNGSTFVPSASIAENTKKNNQGADMEFNQSNFDILLESRSHLNGNIQALTEKLAELTTALEAKESELDALVASHTTKLSEAETKLVDFKAEVQTRLLEAKQTGVTFDTALAMVNASTAEEASKIALDEKESNGRTHQENMSHKEDLWADIK